EGGLYNKWRAYGQGKTANILLAVALAAKLGDKRLTAVSLHPGVIGTNLANHLDWNIDFAGLQAVDRELGNTEGWNEGLDFKTPARGVMTHVVAAFDPALKECNGQYLQDGHVADPYSETIRPYARDKIEAHKLWKLSEKLLSWIFQDSRVVGKSFFLFKLDVEIFENLGVAFDSGLAFNPDVILQGHIRRAVASTTDTMEAEENYDTAIKGKSFSRSSLLVTALELLEIAGTSVISMGTQYRMIPQIAYFPLTRFYHGIKNHGTADPNGQVTQRIETVRRRRPIRTEYFLFNIPQALSRTAASSETLFNHCNAKARQVLVTCLLDEGVPADDIVILPFSSAQVNLISDNFYEKANISDYKPFESSPSILSTDKKQAY
ncbi:MAG: hypothetical protein Q9204_007826, partial [Flavoplaca sp. TL-2023a]